MEYCSQWLQFLDGYVCRPLHLTLEVAKYLALELRIDIVECAEVIEASPIHSLTVDAFGEGLEELLSILCAIGSMLLKLHDVEADEPVASGKHAVDGMCCLLAECLVYKKDAVSQLVKCHCYIRC